MVADGSPVSTLAFTAAWGSDRNVSQCVQGSFRSVSSAGNEGTECAYDKYSVSKLLPVRSVAHSFFLYRTDVVQCTPTFFTWNDTTAASKYIPSFEQSTH